MAVFGIIISMKRSQQRRRFEDLPLEAREQFAENTKERIYSTITLLAIVTTLWHTSAHHSPLSVLAGIVGSVVALWLATLMSARMSYRAVHGTSIPTSEYRKIFFSASGLLAPAALPSLLVIASMGGLFELKTALFASMIVLLLSLFLFSLMGSRRVYQSKSKVLIISLIELGIGLLVVGIKLLAGE